MVISAHDDVCTTVPVEVSMMSSVHDAVCSRGHTCLPDDEVKALYNGSHVGIMNMNSFYGTV